MLERFLLQMFCYKMQLEVDDYYYYYGRRIYGQLCVTMNGCNYHATQIIWNITLRLPRITIYSCFIILGGQGKYLIVIDPRHKYI